MPTSDVPEQSGKRVRTPRQVTNVRTLGEIQLVDVDVLVSLLGEADNIWLTDVVEFRAPETYKESLECPERQEWKHARHCKRKALLQRGVMKVVPTPPNIKPIKSRYVYKRNTTRM